MMKKEQAFFLLITFLLFSSLTFINLKYREEIISFYSELINKVLLNDSETGSDGSNLLALTQQQKFEEIMEQIKKRVGGKVFFRPDEVKIFKIGDGSYKIVNNFDNYSFILPNSWNNDKVEDIVISYFRHELILNDVSSALVVEDKDQSFVVSVSEDEVSPEITLDDFLAKIIKNDKMSLIGNTRNNSDIPVIFYKKEEENKDKIFTYFRENECNYTIIGLDKKTALEIINTGQWNSKPDFSIEEVKSRENLFKKIDNL